MRALVDDAIDILNDPKAPIAKIGELLNETWQYKRSLADGVTSPEIDELYERARSAGALGGKLLGAGGGGFLLLFAPPERQAAVREKLASLVHVPFNFESTGSRVVLYQPDGL
jgi:D-glycero-alpha-D-manno-heptose-7-phosphate kinase